MLKLLGIRSLPWFNRLGSLLAKTVLYPQESYTRRYLNSFRGEPAISELD